MLKAEITRLLREALDKLSYPADSFVVTTPSKESFGEYATSLPLQLAKILKKSPMEIGQNIKEAIPPSSIIREISIIAPGFLNISVSNSELMATLEKDITIPPYHLGETKKIMVEYAHPNTHKLFHIGHLRNITTGETIARILEAVGNTVIRVNYQGDVGLHIAKALYGLKKELTSRPELRLSELPLKQRIVLLGKGYAKGNTAYESSDDAKQEIISINRMIYEQSTEIRPLWEETRDWSLEYFNTIYARVGTVYDRFYFESQMAQRALELAQKASNDGILSTSDGAIILQGESHGVDTRVFVNRLGFPTYEGKELALAEKESTDYGDLDKIIHVVGGEQVSFFKTTFKAEELIDPTIKGKQKHLVYGWVDVKGNKMSSRKGNVVEGAWLLDTAKQAIINEYHSDEQVAEILAVAAVKYAFLKNGLASNVQFDLSDAITLQGDSGPYLIYTYVRARSILAKNGDKEIKTNSSIENGALNDEERSLLVALAKYGEIVQEAAINYSPNMICLQLYGIAQKYNLLYQKWPILKEDNNSTRALRLKLTHKTALVLKHGLGLLGIQTVEKI